MFTITNERNIQTTYIMSQCLKQIEYGDISISHPLHNSTKDWNDEEKGNLITTILNSYLFPSIAVVETFKNNREKYYIIDGTQRIKTCLDFKNNKFEVDKKSKRPIIKYKTVIKDENNNYISYKVEEFDLRGKFYKDLPEELQDIFNEYNIKVDLYSQCTEDDIIFHIERYNYFNIHSS